jgi:hypothetical protein
LLYEIYQAKKECISNKLFLTCCYSWAYLNSLPNQIDIFDFGQNTKHPSNNLAKDLGIFRNLEKNCLLCTNIYLCTPLGIIVSRGGKPGGRVENIKDIEGFFMQM